MTDRSLLGARVEGINGELRVLAGDLAPIRPIGGLVGGLVIGVLLIATRCGPPT